MKTRHPIAIRRFRELTTTWELAKVSGYSNSTIKRMEGGEYPWSENAIERIALALGAHPKVLTDEITEYEIRKAAKTANVF